MAGDEAPRARQAVELTGVESWELLSGVSVGRIVFTQRAMPAIRPVNHLVDGQTIIVRSHLGAAIAERVGNEDGVVVCYEAHSIDPERHTGWSVIATGMARLVRDPASIARYEQLLEPWAASRLTTSSPSGLRSSPGSGSSPDDGLASRAGTAE